MQQKSLKKNLVYSVAQKLISLLMPVITFPYASRILLPEGIGKVNFAHSIISYFTMIAGLGISTYAIREGAKIRDDNDKFSKFTKEMFTINSVSTVVAYVLLFISLFFVKKLHPYTALILICSINMFLSVLGISWMYNAKEEFRYISIRSIVFQLLSLVYLFVFVRTKDDIIHYTIFGILNSTGSNILNFIHSRKFINWKTKYQLEIKKHLKPIFILFGKTAADTVYLVLDISILGFIAGDEAVGFYTAASKINKIVMNLLIVQNTIMLPRLSYYAEHDYEKYKALLTKSFNLSILFMIPSFIGFTLLSKDIMIIFCGNNYLPAINTMIILNGLILIMTMSSFFSSTVLIPFRKDKYSLYAAIIGAVSNFILNLVLIPKYSHQGAAVATIVAEFLHLAAIYIFSVRTIGHTKGIAHDLYQYVIAAGVMGVAVYFMHKYYYGNLLSIIVEIIAGAVIYGLILLIFRNQFLLNTIRNVLGKLKKKK